MDAPTPITTEPVAAITANKIQADSVSLAVDDATGRISASVVVSYYAQAEEDGPKTFARDTAGRKITDTITVPDVAARAGKRAGQGSALMVTWLNAGLSLIPDELARQLVERKAVADAQALAAETFAAFTAARTTPHLDVSNEEHWAKTLKPAKDAMEAAQVALKEAQDAEK